jgi:phosphopantothenate---cysteine ligase (CTP)
VKCLVTAGPAYEPLDDVRRLTNFSTGRLGSELVNFLSASGHEVILLIGQQSTWRGDRKAAAVQTFTSSDDLCGRLGALAGPQVQAVFHAAAVSDFKFGKVWQGVPGGPLLEIRTGKIPTRAGNLLVELAPTPKIISKLRAFFPAAVLVGWKYEIEGGRGDVLEKARQQITENQTNACVANGAAYGSGFGLVTTSGQFDHCETTKDLFVALEALLHHSQLDTSNPFQSQAQRQPTKHY